MNTLPPVLHEAVTQILGAAPQAAIPLPGGMINQAARIETPFGPLVVKWNEGALPGLFASEADGLERLRAAGALRVPKILAVSDAASRPLPLPDGEQESVIIPSFLVMEYIDPLPGDIAEFARRFGESLARQHQTTTSENGLFGLERDNYIGALPQPNAWRMTWPEFYRERRLLPQLAIALRLGRLPGDREARLRRLVDQVDTILADSRSLPCLLHGDLWSGNFLQSGEEAIVIDPAVYYGDREIELAYIQLFGGFPPGFIEAYQSAYPLPGEYLLRRPLHQLYPLLFHLNTFGEEYWPQVEMVLLRYGC
ncbi:fructosamine kinase [Capsulimonas corticalis]|uniref:Fructosamine kinase n=1 Tax=Capsulimonas corticalis TaxID=2219043 RepID=A0A402D4H7_9BACT|nr:fructosamine kinase family protein [Capsulimonas corticalis]BDI29151.1 fructosamine kinase [Capsulimonas corticalis]